MSFATKSPRARLGLESLETRYAPAALNSFLPAPRPALAPAIVAGVQPMAMASVSSSIGDRMANFLEAKRGVRVGGGECAHIATEALRVAGGKFVWSEHKTNPDYVWGTKVTRVTYNYSTRKVEGLANVTFKRGDVIQYQDASFSNRGTIKHHTAVVAAVNAKGQITEVYEQNIGKLTGGTGGRTVHRRTAVDLTKLTGGSVTMYRAQTRSVQSGRYEITLVNNTSSSRDVEAWIGTHKLGTYSLTSANTLSSFKSLWMSGSTRPSLTVAGKSISLDDGGAYEVYTTSSGTTAIRKLS